MDSRVRRKERETKLERIVEEVAIKTKEEEETEVEVGEPKDEKEEGGGTRKRNIKS